MAMTKADMQAALDEAGIEYPADATKADLEALMPEQSADMGPDEDYRILVANGPFNGQEGKVTMARGEADQWVALGWLEPAGIE